MPKLAAKLNGIARAAIAVRGSTDGTQSAPLRLTRGGFRPDPAAAVIPIANLRRGSEAGVTHHSL